MIHPARSAKRKVKAEEMLDWMQEHRAEISVNDEETLGCRVQSSDDFEAHGYSEPYDIREAVRSAMRASGAGKEESK